MLDLARCTVCNTESRWTIDCVVCHQTVCHTCWYEVAHTWTSTDEYGEQDYIEYGAATCGKEICIRANFTATELAND